MDEETHPPEQPEPPEQREPPGPPEPPDAEPVVCARCGAAAEGGSAPATWICSVENGVRHYFCDDCAREHIRSIEGRLDSDWW
ncbi:hypothetical protein PUR49_34670 [Streptomyces sp. BE147]|uniref:hypothetical protein n=1 Tax=Streptomyces sp. BE147 TaxID=3002524 RepID=UPI002E79FF0E|nr:hypothetical protein [Streptomyces sp. BE147]MEE1741617.1 hypothetical protein [Streptomyces sp. BE147]